MEKQDSRSRMQAAFRRLRNPAGIQAFLDELAYDPAVECRSPGIVISEGKAHCFEGAVLAAAALRYLQFEPLLLDMRAVNDDDHVITPFRINKCWGAIAKSNFSTLRFREPVYRTLRELVMSYFDFYFNTAGEKTLRSYSPPLNLRRFDKREWETAEESLDYIGEYLDRMHHYPLLTPQMAPRLQKADEQLLMAGLFGANKKGLYKPK